MGFGVPKLVIVITSAPPRELVKMTRDWVPPQRRGQVGLGGVGRSCFPNAGQMVLTRHCPRTGLLGVG